MSERITHASDGTPGIERDHTDDALPSALDGLFDAECEDCGEQWEVEVYGRLLCFRCAENDRGDRAFQRAQEENE